MDSGPIRRCSAAIFDDIADRIQARAGRHAQPACLLNEHFRDLVMDDIERHLRDLLAKARLPAAACAA
jgi:hypothetical protein